LKLILKTNLESRVGILKLILKAKKVLAFWFCSTSTFQMQRRFIKV